MAIFHVGQRVRLVWPRCGLPEPHAVYLIGQEATILSIALSTPFLQDPPPCGSLWHELDKFCERGGRNWSACACCLEPIVDDGRKVVTWRECRVWNPDHLRETEPA